MPLQQLRELLADSDPNTLAPFLESKIKMESLNLEAQKLLGNEWECHMSKHRIADAKILLLVLSGDLTL